MRVGDAGFRVEIEVAGVFNVEWWLEILGENVCGVVFCGHSPDSHQSINVVLPDCVVSDAN